MPSEEQEDEYVLSTTNTPDKHGACQRPLGHSGGGPPLDTCKQSAQARRPPLPRSNGPDLEPVLILTPEAPWEPNPPSSVVLQAPNQQLHITPTQKIQERRRTEPPAHRSYHLALEGGGDVLGSRCPWIHLHQQTLERVHFQTFVCTIVVMARAGKSTAGRPSASTHIQDQDPSQVQEPGGDRETFQEQPLTQHTPIRDARNVIELNQYKYTNVPVAEEHMANLTSHELAEAIGLYRDEQARAQMEFEQDDEQEESGDSQQSRRSVFDRIGAKAKKNQKEPSKKETEATRKKKLEEIREKIRKEEEEKLEQKNSEKNATGGGEAPS
ncbi:hypothetical protein AgCh_024896 [Apium graveolens]